MLKYLVVPLFFISLDLRAQDSLLYRALVPRHALKISPFHLAGFYPTLQLAYEGRVSTRTTLQLEGGVVLNYPANDDTQYQDKRGAKGKLEIHYYTLPSRRAKLVYYGAAELYRNAVNFDRLTSQQECFDVECNHMFTRQYSYTVMYREGGFGFKVGFIKYFHDFFMDINSGWGVRFITYTDSPGAPDFNNDNITWAQMFSIPNEEDRTTLSPIVGIRLGYRLHKSRTKRDASGQRHSEE